MLCLAVSDVSDKGMPAALSGGAHAQSSARLSALPQTLAATSRPASSRRSSMALLNDELCKNNPICMFVTLFLGFLCIRTGKLTFANAGHLPPWRIAPGEQPVQLPCKPGPPPGMMPGSTYRDYVATLEPGDALVVITDGLPEMMDATGAFYTMERVAIDIASLSNHTPVQIVTELAARVMDFAAGTSQADDVTALAVRIGHRSA